jgi:serine protease Do
MHPSLRAIALVTTTALATSAVVFSVATAQSPTPAPQMVVGLPDFTNLVDQVGPAVVSIEASVGGRGQSGQVPDDMEMPEFFRRFGIQHALRVHGHFPVTLDVPGRM